MIVDEVNVLNGFVHVRMVKSDGGMHRTCLPVSGDADKQLQAVNDHLLAMGVASIPDSEWDKVRQVMQ